MRRTRSRAAAAEVAALPRVCSGLFATLFIISLVLSETRSAVAWRPEDTPGHPLDPSNYMADAGGSSGNVEGGTQDEAREPSWFEKHLGDDWTKTTDDFGDEVVVRRRDYKDGGNVRSDGAVRKEERRVIRKGGKMTVSAEPVDEDEVRTMPAP